METMYNLNKGATKVACSNHTLILGWNESTVRCVCQIAFLRRAFLMQNETWARRLFPWLRVKPSSPVASAPVVLMCNTMTKEEMDHLLEEALLERGISPKRTKVGWDVICRVGDPCDPHDLLRVGAHRATSIMTMMTNHDQEEEEVTEGILKTGYTLRTLLALRHVGRRRTSWDELRIVLHLAKGPTEEIDAAKFKDPDTDRDIVFGVDLRAFVNSLMFNCSAYPGMSGVFMELISFEGFSFRSKKASELGLVGKTFEQCSLIWTDAVVIGVIDTRPEYFLDPTVAVKDQGIVCDPSRPITAHDRVIFIAKNAFPNKVGKILEKPELEDIATRARDPFDILICGWREEWS